MAREQEIHPTEERLSIRTNADQKSTLRRAAEARQMNVSQFVLQTSLQAAELVLQEQSRVVVSAEDYDWLCELMDEAPRSLPHLREAMSRPPVWDA
jgi:uncharacterized protein (DUF1778 family)